MANKKISELVSASTLTGTEIVPIVQGGTTKKTTAGDIASLGGALFTEVSGTLVAGSTTLVLQDASITTSSTIDVYADVYGVSPVSISVATGSVTLTFEARAGDLGVKVRIW